MNWNWEELKTKVDVVNKFIMTIAIVVGGIWVWYSFDGELKKENADALHQKTIREIEALNRKVTEVVVASKVIPNFENKYLVEVQVMFYNKGTINVEIPIKDISLRITRITVPELPMQPLLITSITEPELPPILPGLITSVSTPEPSMQSQVQFQPLPLITNIEGEVKMVNSLYLPAGGQDSLLYLARVDQSGNFLVEFSTLANKDKSFYPNKEISDNELIYISAQDSNAKIEEK
jgi:hypothetical protein